MFYRIKEIIRNVIVRLLMSKKNNLQDIVSCNFDAVNSTEKYIINSSIITRYQIGEEVSFFRECRKHFSLKKYLFLAIDNYFDSICNYANKIQLKKDILSDLEQKSNYRKLIKLGGVFDANLMDILAGTYCDYQTVGLPCFVNHTNEQFILFIQYVNCIIISQRVNDYVKKGSYENYSANKQLATYKLAKLLGVVNLIPEVKVCSLIDKSGVEKLGTLMDNAPGIPPSELFPEDRKNLDKNSFLKDITNLEYFDALCYQLDHRLDNYHVVKNDEGIITNIVAFDNDANRTFFVSAKLPKRTYSGSERIVVHKSINRPYIDAQFAKSLNEITKKALINQVGLYMTRIQLNALWKRIKLLRTAIGNSVKKDKNFLVNHWDKVEVKDLASEKFGTTYFNLYLNDTLMLDRKKQFELIKN